MTPRPPSLRAFARSQGVSPSAITRAVSAGRITAASVGRDAKGRSVLLDPARAAEELANHTRPRIDSRKANGPAPPTALADATLRERRARAWAIELAIAQRTRELVPSREVEQRWAALVVEARTRLLSIPSRVKQRLPHLTMSDLAGLDALIRETLEAMADDAGGPTAVHPSTGGPR